jgi:RNA recognition motif-containing protein
MEAKMYVGNLSYQVTEQQLRELFGQAGTVVSAVIIKESGTQQSKGFGFVEMSSQAEMQKAISMFNGYSMNDRQLTVNVARPREDRGGFRSRGGQGDNRRRY